MSKKLMVLFALVTMAIFAISMVSARTLVTGQIYNSDFTAKIPGANVTVTCNSVTNTTVSITDGVYAVKFANGVCGPNSNVIVNASDGALHGSASGTIINGTLFNLDCGMDLGVVNVPLVPEFGLVAGSITIVAAIAFFFFVRKK